MATHLKDKSVIRTFKNSLFAHHLLIKDHIYAYFIDNLVIFLVNLWLSLKELNVLCFSKWVQSCQATSLTIEPLLVDIPVECHKKYY